jgi:antitoxin YefM
LKATFHGREIEIVVSEVDETDYLLKSEANRERLLAATANIQKGTNLIEFSLDSLE